MNTDLIGFITFFRDKSLNGIIVTDKGKTLSDKEARAYIEYCIEKGHVDLYSCPEFEDVKSELKY